MAHTLHKVLDQPSLSVTITIWWGGLFFTPLRGKRRLNTPRASVVVKRDTRTKAGLIRDACKRDQPRNAR